MLNAIFGRREIPDRVPRDMEKAIKILKNSKNKEDCLKKAYDILSRKYRGYRVNTYLRFPELFISDMEKLWGTNGFMHCTNINYVLRTLLIKSGFFKENDIDQKWTMVWYVSPHQYLRVRTGKNKFTNVDIWTKPYGIGYGQYAHGFH